jgi:hypothetical protein
MRAIHILGLFLVVTLVAVPFVGAQGITWESSFTVVNASSSTATVTVHFYAEDGTVYTPNPLVPSEGIDNPFTLPAGNSQIIVMDYTSDSLPSGRYSVEVESDQLVKVIVNLLGTSGTIQYNGSYSGQGIRYVSEQYLPSVNKNFFGWNSRLSLQNLTASAMDIQVDFYQGSPTIIHTVIQNVDALSSWHLDVSTIDALPDNYNGSAVVSASGEFAIVDNQINTSAIPGATQTYGSLSQGSNFLYCPGLYDQFFGWFSSLNIQNVDLTTATVTVQYSDGISETNQVGPNSAWLIVFGSGTHDTFFSAKVVGDHKLVAIANANAGPQSQTYECLSWFSTQVNVPLVMKDFAGAFNTAVQIQNVDVADGNVTIMYEGYEAFAYSVFLPAGATHIFYTPGEAFLPEGYAGAATISSARTLTAIVNQTNDNPGSATGDFSLSYHAVADWGNKIYAPVVVKSYSGLSR